MYDNGLVLDIPIIRKTTCRSLSSPFPFCWRRRLTLHSHTIKQTRNKGVCLLREEFEQKNGVLEHGRGPQENQWLPQPFLRRRFDPGRGFPQAAPLSLIQQPRYPLSRRCPQRLRGHAFTWMCIYICICFNWNFRVLICAVIMCDRTPIDWLNSPITTLNLVKFWFICSVLFRVTESGASLILTKPLKNLQSIHFLDWFWLILLYVCNFISGIGIWLLVVVVDVQCFYSGV